MFKPNDLPIWREPTKEKPNAVTPRQPQPGWGFVQTAPTTSGRVITQPVKKYETV